MELLVYHHVILTSGLWEELHLNDFLFVIHLSLHISFYVLSTIYGMWKLSECWHCYCPLYYFYIYIISLEYIIFILWPQSDCIFLPTCVLHLLLLFCQYVWSVSPPQFLMLERCRFKMGYMMIACGWLMFGYLGYWAISFGKCRFPLPCGSLLVLFASFILWRYITVWIAATLMYGRHMMISLGKQPILHLIWLVRRLKLLQFPEIKLHSFYANPQP